MRMIALVTILTALFLADPHPAAAQTGDDLRTIKKELEGIKESQKAVERQLQEIKTLLQARPAAAPAQPQNVVLSVEGAAFKGERNAKVTLIEFTDVQCPFCSRHVLTTAPQIEENYVKTGKVKHVVRDFPIESLHPQAFKGHEAVRCASDQGKYWEMSARLFANQKAMAPTDVSGHAQALALDLSAFRQCLDGGKYAAKIRKDMTDAQQAGVTGTPTFFLGLTDPRSSEVKVVRVIKGAQPYAAFSEAIENLLSQK